MGVGAVFAGERVSLRLLSIPARLTLAGLIGISAALRFAFALRRGTITYFPDEYTYSALARSLATTGRADIRGVPAHFPALLEPLLAAPFWLLGRPELAFRLTQAESCLLMSLGAIPVYLLARRLSLPTGVALGCAAVTLAAPGLLYGSYLTADGVAYPLVLGSVYAAVVALEQGRRRAQLSFVVLAGLTSFARVQYLLLFFVYALAALVLARLKPREVVRLSGWVLGLLVIGAGVVLALGPGRLLGVYDSALHLHTSASTLLHQALTLGALLPFSAGIVLIPGALVAFARGLRKPLSASEGGFAAFSVFLALGLIGEALLIAASISGNYSERYMLPLFPLLLPAFCLYASRGGAARIVVALSASLALLAMRVPLSGYASGKGKTDSVLLDAVSRIESVAGIGRGALIVSLVGFASALCAAYVAGRPATRMHVALVVALLSSAALAVGATSWDIDATRQVRATSLPTDASWVDDSHLGPVTVLESPGALAPDTLEELFWNSSITRVVLLYGAAPVDGNANPLVEVASDGRMRVGGAPLAGPLLIDDYRSWLALSGVRLVATGDEYRLFAPSGTPRLSYEVLGLRHDHWLADQGTITFWSAAQARRFSLQLSLPSSATSDTLHYSLAGRAQSLVVPSGGSAVLRIEVPADRKIVVPYFAEHWAPASDGQPVSFKAGQPELTTVTSG